jgi:kynureninase
MTALFFEPGRAFAQSLDSNDPLKSFRDEFIISDPSLIYMDGNSLGRLPRRAIDRVNDVVNKEWGERLIRSWGEGWFSAPQRIGEKIAQLVGAAPGQVVVSDSTSVDLFKAVMAALDLLPERFKIVTDSFNFPSDLYVLQGCASLLNGKHIIQVVPSEDTITPDLPALYDAIDESTALVTLSHVGFKSGYLYDAAEITRRAHQAGALVLWDLSHSAGALPVSLDEWQADLAVGCTYKYLNGGPGAPAYIYVRRSLQEHMRSPIWGWFGDQRPFAFDLDYLPDAGIKRFQCGTPPILSMLAIEPGLDLLLEAGIHRLREKSMALSSYLIALFDTTLAPLGFVLGSPRQLEQRGSHVSIRHPEGYRINRALIEDLGVLPDFREPDNIRLGLAPLYTSYEDIYETIERIRSAVAGKLYLKYPAIRQKVT